jgi:hypothetical protein
MALVLHLFVFGFGRKPRSRMGNAVFEGNEATRQKGSEAMNFACKSLCLCMGTTPRADHPPFTHKQHTGRAQKDGICESPLIYIVEWRFSMDDLAVTVVIIE